MKDHDKIIRLEEKLLASHEARELQAKEYERRLQDLNHENARIAANAAVYLPREVFEQYIKETNNRLELINTVIISAREQSAGQSIGTQRIIIAGGVVFGIIGVFIGAATFFLNN